MKKNLNELKSVLEELKVKNKVLLAYLFGSYAGNTHHRRSDLDVAVYLNTNSDVEKMEMIDKILMSVDKQVDVLMLDDEDESPFVVQEALKGVPLVEPDTETFYKLSDRVLHETESIRFKRG